MEKQQQRLIDANALDTVPWEDALDAIIAIKNAPTIDAVEVVRCKDCVYWDGRGYEGRCEPYRNGLIREYTNYDDFCSYGVRKEDVNA